MKKFLTYILILTLAIGFVVPLAHIHAQATVNLPQQQSAGCSVWSLDVGGCLTAFIDTIATAILSLMSFVLYLAGILLNFVLKHTIVEMKDNISQMSGINIAWKSIRDLMNIAFIFLLVYEAILLIIQQNTTDSIKKFLIGLVMSAILINFSLFFTKVLIDASNVVTIGFYNAIIGPDGAANNRGMSDRIMANLNITSVFNSNVTSQFGTGKTFSGVAVMALGGALLILITSFVFFAVSILFVVRYFILIILLMFSPIGYMSMALPQLKSYSSRWWDSLKGQLLFGPIYMIMMWAILTLMSSKGFVSIKGNLSDAWSANQGSAAVTMSSMGLLVNFAIIIGLIITALVTAKDFATQGSKLIGQFTDRASAFAGDKILGGAARFGRNTIGRSGQSLADNDNLKQRATEGGIGGMRARILLAAGNKAATSTFDARNAPGASGLSKQTGFNFGKVDVKKDNYRAIKDEQIKKEVKDTEKYKPSDAAAEKAKQRLSSEEFKAEEEKRKAERKEYLDSEKYKNSEEYKNREKLKTSTTEMNNSSQRLVALRASLQNQDRGTNEYYRVEASIAQAEKDLAESKKTKDNLQKTVDQYETDDVNEGWISNERKNLISVSGGTKIENKGGGKEIKDQSGTVIGKIDSKGVKTGIQSIDSAYQQRTEAVAKKAENRGAAWRWSANTAGLVTNVAGLTSQPMTKAERQELGKKIRGLTKAQSNQDKIVSALKAAQKESDDAEKAAAGTPETPPAAPAGGAPAGGTPPAPTT